jgi:hypothetical protein
MTLTLYHVTTPETAELILNEGFSGVSGENGLGVYLFSWIVHAEIFALDGGSRGTFNEAVILEVKVESHEVFQITIDPSWPDPVQYIGTLFHPMGDDDRWVVEAKIIKYYPPVDDPAAERWG